jgi:hypothetical protein
VRAARSLPSLARASRGRGAQAFLDHRVVEGHGERLLRYCARPPFALDRLRELDREHLVYEPPKAGPGGSGPQCVTPLELLDRLATVVPPPRIRRHRYFGVLAPNSPLRTAVTALAPGATTAAPVRPGLHVRPAPQLVARTPAARPSATPAGLVLATARLPARGHPGARAHPKVPRQACGDSCRRNSTPDPPYRLLHTQPHALEMTIR